MLIKHTHLPSRIILYTLVKQSQLALTHSSCNVIITCREKYQQFLHSHFVTLCLSFDWKNTNYDEDVRYRLIGYEFFLLFISFYFGFFDVSITLFIEWSWVCCMFTANHLIWHSYWWHKEIKWTACNCPSKIASIAGMQIFVWHVHNNHLSLSFQGQWWHAIAT